MAWLAGIVVLILIVISSGFRKFAGALIVLAVLAFTYSYVKDEREKKNHFYV